MITIQLKNINEKTIIPVAGSELATGYDIIAIDDPIVVGNMITKEDEVFTFITSPIEEQPSLPIFYRSIDYLEYHTGLYVSPQENYHLLIHPRSSIRKYQLTLANGIGLIDNDYRGEIIVCFKYNWQPTDFVQEYKRGPLLEGSSNYRLDPTGKLIGKINYDKIYRKGDKIGQLVAEGTNKIQFKLVSELTDTLRGTGGFGSSDTPSKSPTITATSNGPITDRYNKEHLDTGKKKKYSDEIKEREAKIVEAKLQEELKSSNSGSNSQD